MRMKSERGGENDEIHNEVRKKCADTHIELAVRDVPAAGTLALNQHAASHRFLFLDFLRGLPEKKVWADGCSQNGNQRRPRLMTFGPAGNESIVHDRDPIRPDDDSGE